ncbi:MAG: ABC transporter ATP-binding protein [Clostridiales bacterium]|nr:ABC transporter ATP-binding protein [Clostridiales bacterium]
MEQDNYAVEVNNVTIRFNLASEKVDNLKEYVIKALKNQLSFKEFFALQDVSFKVKKGEAWALIGINGSGKSTMLKAISGILKPYKGSITVRGEVAPLIELGAGFDGDMTARENIFLNGTVLGHSRKYMEEHFDEIVDFAELWDFLDTPIKNYSSGMKARLGFSVATMVSPDILICDEVLSVGDFLFREKCMNRMADMLSGGTTLLFVSHSVEQVLRLCQNAVWLDQGRVREIGPAEEVCQHYAELAKAVQKKGARK